MNFLIVAAGSHGDVLPFVGLGQELQGRGHRVRLFASAVFETLAAEAGLPFTEVLSTDEYRQFLADPAATEPRHGMALVARSVAQAQRRCLARLQAACEPGRTVLIGSSLAWATRLLGERDGLPVVTAHLAPAWFRSNHRAPAFGPLGHLERAPAALKRLLWWGMDRRFLDPLFTEPFNALRAEHGLPPVHRLFHRWVHQGDLTLGLYPAWFAPPQPDAPAQARLVGFPLVDGGGETPLPAHTQRFLDAGQPPVVFTTGTANATSHAFFEASVRACQLLGKRGLLVTHEASQLPAALPPSVAHASYLPFRSLLPRVAALVHHGGIGTSSQALLAGVPQLVRPMAFDQFDNAQRLITLGVAQQLRPQQYRAERVARTLDVLLGDAGVLARCAALADRLRREGSGLAEAADRVLALAAQKTNGSAPCES